MAWPMNWIKKAELREMYPSREGSEVSDTPRTDEVARTTLDFTSLCRQLERELTQAYRMVVEGLEREKELGARLYGMLSEGAQVNPLVRNMIAQPYDSEVPKSISDDYDEAFKSPPR